MLAVLGALFANGLITVLKFVAAVITGSSGMMAELLTMHLAPKQILINAHVNLRDDLVTSDIVQTIEEVEGLIKRAEPKVEMIFLETARQSESSDRELVTEHMG